MKTLFYQILTTVLIFISGAVSAQETVSFGYDATGNRTSRTIILEEMKTERENLSDTSFIKQSEIKENDVYKYSTKISDRTISIYPNPNGGMFKVSIEGGAAELNGHIQLHTLNGNPVFDEPALQPETNVDITGQPNGTYILTIIIDGRKEVWKVVKR